MKMKSGESIPFTGSFTLDTYSHESGSLVFNPKDLIIIIENKKYKIDSIDEDQEFISISPISEK